MIYQKTLFAFIMLFFFSAKITKAGSFNDSTTSKSIEPCDSTKRKIAFANNNAYTEYYTIPANVIYPHILKENVEETKDYVEKFVNSRKDYVLRMYSKGKASFPKIITAFKKYNLPEEYRVLIALESAFNGNAVSGVGAVGYWQIMDKVAKEYKINYISRDGKKSDTSSSRKTFTDDRKSFTKSTIVAAKYLRDRNRNLHGNVLLIVASYNCGIGNVWKAMAKSGKASPSFWDVKQFLPMETRNYVMNFIALNVLFKNYKNMVANNLIFNPIKVKKGNSLEKNNTAAL